MKILVIDATGAAASVSVISEDGNIYTELSDDMMSHLELLMPMVQKVMEKSGAQRNEITHIAAAAGPGSFTGIRIGLATAIMLAQAWNLPMISLSSLAFYAYALRSDRTMICPMLDARHRKAFSGAFLSMGDREAAGAYPKIINEEDLRDLSDFVKDTVAYAGEQEKIEKIIFCGDCAEKFRDLIEAAAGVRPASENIGQTSASGVSVEISEPAPEVRAEALAEMALQMTSEGLTVTYQTIKPVYLRKSEAERKLEAKELGKKKKPKEEQVIFELPPEDEEITYRRASSGDAEKMTELDRLCFKTAWSLSSFQGELDGGKNTIYTVAENSRGELIGFAGIAYVLDEGEINRVAVHPLYRGRGIGDRMMDIILPAAEEQGVTIQFLEVREANRSAIALYKNHGFSVTGKREGYYAETGENALMMQRKTELQKSE